MITDARLIQFYIHHLTQRQRQIVTLVVNGLKNDDIGAYLYIESNVVAGHLTNIYGLMGTLDECESIQPNRYLVIRWFVPLFERYPELRAQIS